MRFTTASRVLAVSLLVGAVTATPGSVQAQIASGLARSVDSELLGIQYSKSFTVDETVAADSKLNLNFANSDFVKCELSATGPVNFQLRPDGLSAGGEQRQWKDISAFMRDNCTAFSVETTIDRTKASLFSVSNEDTTASVRVTGGCTLTSKRRLRDPTNRGAAKILKDHTMQTHNEVLEVAPGAQVTFHLKRGLTKVRWDMSASCKTCKDTDFWAIYSLYETEQWKLMEAANVNDRDATNDKPLSMACQNTFADMNTDSARVLPLDTSRHYTFVVFNPNREALTVAGFMTASLD